MSDTNNLVDGDTNSIADLFAKDFTTGSTTRVSTSSDNAQDNTRSTKPVLSPDGTKIVFFSYATNLVSGDTDGTYNVFLNDLVIGNRTCASTSSEVVQGYGRSAGASFLPDGQKLYLMSDASNLVPGDTYGSRDIFVRDLASGTVTRVSTDSNGGQLNLGSYYVDPALLTTGTKLAFTDRNTNAIYIKDFVTRSLTPVAPAPRSSQFYELAFNPVGTELIFVSEYRTLISNVKNNAFDVFKSRIAQTITGFVQDKADQTSVSASGALPFTDPDIGDTHTVTIKPGNGVVGSLTAKVAKEPGSGAAGSIAWDHTVDHKAVANLAKDKTKVETFTVTVDDGHGGIADQVVTITVRGSASPASPATSAPSGASVSTQSHADTVSTASLSPTDHTAADNAHVLDTHHGHGLTGFEI